MLSSVFSLLLSCVVAMLLSSSGWCYQMYRPFDDQQQQMFRRGSRSSDDIATYPKIIAADIFGAEDSSDRENDSSLSSDELSVLSSVIPASSSMMSKRRKGPTLSVVNPLEVLRQRLMLDLAKQRIRENQKQIVANGELLEKIGKRSRHSEDEFRAMMVEGGGNNFQP